jgi:hypothetical protein
MSANIFGASGNSSRASTVDKKYVDSKFIALTKSLDAKLDKSGGTVTGEIDVNQNRILNVGNPQETSDAINKKYVDDRFAISRRNLQLKVNKAGDVMNGDLNMGGFRVVNLNEPVAQQDAASKRYVDNKAVNVSDVGGLSKIEDLLSIKLDLNPMNSLSLSANGLMSSGLKYPLVHDFNASNKQICFVGDPTNPQDAANKNYVDNKYLTLIGSLINQTTTSRVSLNFDSPANSMVRLLLFAYSTNFSVFNGTHFMLGPLIGGYVTYYGYVSSGNIVLAPNLSPCVGIRIIGFSSSNITFVPALINGATGWSMYVYN